jgi:hypothetical protein
VQDIVIRPLLLCKVVEKLWSWTICHQHQQYPCYGSMFQPENKSCAKSKQQQFPCCVLSSMLQMLCTHNTNRDLAWIWWHGDMDWAETNPAMVA